MKTPLAQRCSLTNVYASWLLLLLLAAVIGWRNGPLAAVLGAAFGLAALWAYVRIFPRLSRVLGYGSVADAAAPSAARSAGVVRLYTAAGCPFCPIVRDRLHALRERMGFTLEEVDVTLRPRILLAQGIRAVPVVEVDGRTHVGHATTAELASFIAMRSAA